MQNTKLVAERRFGSILSLIGDIQVMYQIAKVKATDTTYVLAFGNGNYASVARLWEKSDKDGHKVYELHIM